MKKRLIPFLIIISIVLSIFMLASCSVKGNDSSLPYPNERGDGGLNQDEYENDQDEYENDVAEPESEEISTLNRKIIYSAYVSFSTENYKDRIAIIKGALKEGDWFDSESISENSAYFVARVKTSRIDAFIEEVTKDIDSTNIRKDAQDISLNYQSIEDQIIALGEEKNILTQYVNDDPAIALQVAKRIAEINTQIQRLNGELNQYDSLIEYSTITISLYREYSATDTAYNERAGNTLTGAWKALLSFFQFFGLAVIAILPWLIIIVPIGGVIVLAIRFKKRLKPFHNIPKKEKSPSEKPDLKDNSNDN